VPQVTPILEEMLGLEEWGHVLPGTPPEMASRYRLDHDNTHFCAPYDPQATTSDGWTSDGMVVGGIHGGDPVTTRTISCVYELLPLEEGCGGTACLSGALHPSASATPVAPLALTPLPSCERQARIGRASHGLS